MTHTTADFSPLLDQADALLAQGKFEEAIAEASKSQESTDALARADAHRICGLAYVQMKKYSDAEKEWEAVIKDDQHRWKDWFNLAISATMNGNVVRGKQAFETVEKACSADTDAPKMGEDIASLTYFYMRSLIETEQYDEALPQLDKLTSLYARIHVTDPSFVFTSTGSSIPPLSEILDTAQPIFQHIGKERSMALLTELAGKIDEEGQQEVKSAIEKLSA